MLAGGIDFAVPVKAYHSAYALLLAYFLSYGPLGCGDKVNPSAKCDPALALDTVTYTGTISTLLSNNCTFCHSSTRKTAKDRQGATLGVDLDSYENAVKWGQESREWVLGGLMPPGPPILNPADPNSSMKLADRCAFATWARNGFPK